MKTKTAPPTTKLERIRVPFEVKAVDEEKRTFRGLAAAFSKDLGNDVIHPGAFKRTLDHWRASKKTRPVPLLDSHNRWSVADVLGKMLDGKETDDGLETEFDFVPDDTTADAAYRRVKGGYVTGLSIGYEPVKFDFEQIEGGHSWDRIRHLREIKLGEVSLVVFPMNQDARVDPASLKGLFDSLRVDVRLTPELKALLASLEEKIDALPSEPVAEPATPQTKELAPDDPDRQRIESLADSIILRHLVSRR